MAALGDRARVKSATIAPSRGYPTGRFPINDAKHARLALELLPTAKNMSAEQETAVKARATRMLAAKRVLV